MSISAMKQALDALQAEANIYIYTDPEDGPPEQMVLAITALRQAIAEAEEFIEFPGTTSDQIRALQLQLKWEPVSEAEKREWVGQPDLARVGEVGIWGHKREWVGFTHEELAWLNEALNLGGRFAVIEAIEAKLKEKNT
jgi:hypothetical protein